MTWCAETARLNGSTFGLSLPANDANRVPDSYGNTPFSTSFESLPAGINVADVVLSSNTTNGKLFGHRALAVRAKTDNAWYILDPYYGNEKPIPVANYLSMYSSKNGGGITHLYGHKGQGVMAGLLA